LSESQAIVVVHGGAGTIEADRLEACVAGCEAAARAGLARMDDGALLGAVAAVRSLEADPAFNAGRGATLTRDGTVELDAAVMTGDLHFGAVAACPPVESAIELAFRIHEREHHRLLVGAGAAAFAEEVGIKLVEPEELIEDRIRAKWRRAMASSESSSGGGTVGAVALDNSGTLAAATSTGGMLLKRSGRVGDTPIPGAGTYADEEAGAAASATGQGEAIMRALLCREAVSEVGSGSLVEDAAAAALKYLERRTGGKAGLIVVTRSGQFHQGKNTDHMPWAAAGGGSVLDSGY
jgi:beta-aspartyl-peptidase (threonine type)